MCQVLEPSGIYLIVELMNLPTCHLCKWLCHWALLYSIAIILPGTLMANFFPPITTVLLNSNFENTTGDNAWVMGNELVRGSFEIAVPSPYNADAQPMELAAYEGTHTLVTDNRNREDIDGGTTTATSPDVVLPSVADSIILNFQYYLAHRANATAVDGITIRVRRSADDAILATVVNQQANGTVVGAVWSEVTYDMIALAGETVYIEVSASDNPGGSRVEAAVDALSITSYEDIDGIATTEVFCATFEDASADNNWTLSAFAFEGDWITATPTPYFTGGTQMEIGAIEGSDALITGVGSGIDLDGGPTIVSSPDITLPTGQDSIIFTASHYFSHYTNSSFDDRFIFQIRRSSDDAVLETVENAFGAASSRPAVWENDRIDLSAYAGETIYLWAYARDISNGSKVEAAIDNVKITAYLDEGPPVAAFPGAVYYDYYNNGIRDSVDIGIAGVTVSAYDDSGALVEQVITDANGDFTFSTLSSAVDYRVEFSTFPAGYFEGAFGPDSRTAVQFLRAGENVPLELGLIDPYDVCEEDPFLILSCFVEGAYNGTYSGSPAIVKVMQSADGHDFTGTTFEPGYQGVKIMDHQDVGATYGMAYDRNSKLFYAGAFHKRYVGYGPAGPDAIYVADMDGNLQGTIELDALTGTTNVAGSDVHDLSEIGGHVYDLGAGDVSFDAVGKRSLGDMELSDDHKTLYVVNLFDRKIYAIDVSDDDPSNATLVTSWNAPDATGASRHRPFGLAWRDGVLYIGSVDEDGTDGYIHTLDVTTGASSLVLTIPLGYSRQAFFGNANSTTTPSDWQAWAANSSVSVIEINDEIGYPQPMISDIEFTSEGDMVIGMRDRFGDQSAASKFFSSTSIERTWGISSGDILKACANAGGYTLETGNTGACANDGGGLDNSGPSGYEFYYWDIFALAANTWNPNVTSGAFHWETAQGALVQLPGKPYIIASVQDPFSDFSGGYLKFENATGGRYGVGSSSSTADLTGGYTIYESGDYNPSNTLPSSNGTAGKSNGLGDFEAACDVSLTVGNYVWHDADQNGRQDPSESPLRNVTVKIYQDGMEIGSVMTDSLGYYYFGGDSDHGLVGGASLTDSTTYEIRILIADAAANDGTVADIYGPTPVGLAADHIDSDGLIGPGETYVTHTFTTGEYGQNDYSFDFGFNSCESYLDSISYVGCSGDGYSIIVNGETYDESNPMGVDTMTTVLGCDSVIVIDLQFGTDGITSQTFDYIGCSGDGYSIVVNGVTYNEANPTGADTLTSVSGCDSILIVDLQFNPEAMVEAGMLPSAICSNSAVNLSDLGASISGGATSGQWSTMGTGTFDYGGNFGGPSPATTYTPGVDDIAAGEIILTLTSVDPIGPCEPVADAVLIRINDLSCSEFPWAGN